CPVVDTCGGGLYAHRYREGTGFANPSVYSADLYRLITHVRDRIDMRTHTLPIEELARGFGGARDVAGLAGSQESIRRALLASVTGQGTPPEAWRLLETLDRDHPEAVRHVLGHPYVRVWAAESARAHPGHLGNIAAAAAVHAGASAVVPVEVIGGRVHLPTLGVLEVAGDGDHLDVRDGRFSIEGGGPWHPVRRLTAGGFSIALEDTDPFRDCHGWPAAPRLTDDEAGRWQAAFTAAWELIETAFPRYAPGLRAGLTTVTPLTPGEAGRDISSTARHAFGAVAAALPDGPDVLALLLIHEFQHVKMGAILDLLDLYDESDGRLFYAPWRDDPRPLEGLLQGTYAHIAVTDFWRVRRHEVPDPGHVQFARWRADTAAAVERLAESGAMTPLGERFVAGMRETVASWLSEPVPAAAEAAAARRSRRHQAAWTLPGR
ncbi:HEXXH motif domain-containing protein, partial [Microbispora corallina]|uniref:HEXXH motif domain-containing protein n=2 Tax=Microbispora corallina TaxID=83302 RepID=UPI0031D6F22F